MTKPTAEDERAAVVETMREAIARGYVTISKDGKSCSHGTNLFADCIPCYDEYLLGQLDAIERGDHHKGKD